LGQSPSFSPQVLYLLSLRVEFWERLKNSGQLLRSAHQHSREIIQLIKEFVVFRQKIEHGAPLLDENWLADQDNPKCA
jgi:hypothetical protein